MLLRRFTLALSFAALTLLSPLSAISRVPQDRNDSIDPSRDGSHEPVAKGVGLRVAGLCGARRQDRGSRFPKHGLQWCLTPSATASHVPLALVRAGDDPEPQAPPRKPAGGARRRAGSYKVAEVKDGRTVIGTVRYLSRVPPARKIQVVKDHPTCDKHPKEVPLIKADPRGLVKEAIVYLANIREGKAFPPAAKKPVIDQRTCEFHPHVQAVRAGEPVEIVNSDPVAHNINASQRIFTLFNILQPSQNMRAEQKFDKPGVVDLKCNVHDWMHGYVHVFNHPYYAITGEDGSFKLENVPPGKYELAVWQEHLGEQIFEIEVKSGETVELAITLEPKRDDKEQ